ncbi:hypothetical protein HQ47_09285 [Porphyromonas macacae]|uniref:dTDP-4-dehydrorhamnose reductase n=1 Tax=Porphyromonas macacae TaxID=28115 RepID=A0A0A2E5P9_9PORP|nr:dTDP-4-dehydrorhamnose reductase [Porphyromonas macacae]KGN72760.1 hypothetical protein HQ47_09285 [Porphyromonas macacae]
MKQTYNLIITGAGGQLGRSLVSAAALQNDTVRLYAATHAELDITQPGALDRYCKTMGIEDTRPTVVINCAAYTAVDKAETEQGAARKLNIEAPKLLAHSCATSGRLLVHISTDYVFDGRGCCPYEEEAATHPLNFYGISKVMGEEVAMGYMPAGQLLVVRTGWLYSPYGSNFALTMLRLACERSSIGVVSDQTGTPTYAPHLAGILLQITALAVEEGSFRTPLLHCSDNGICSWYDMAYMLLSYANKMPPEGVIPIPSTEYPVPAERPLYSVLSKQRLKELYNITPPHWSVGLKKLLLALDESTDRRN